MDSLRAFRARAIRLAVYVGGLVVLGSAIAVLLRGGPVEPPVVVALSAAGASIAVMWTLAWRSDLTTKSSGFALGLWAVLWALGMFLVAMTPGLAALALTWSITIVAWSAALGTPGQHGAIAGLVVVTYLSGTVVVAGNPLGDAITAGVALGILGFVCGVACSELRRLAAGRSQLLAELQRRDLAFERLYEVITTLSVASSLRLALPELVGRIGRYFRAQVGLVVLHDPEHEALEVVSPIWTAGYSLEIDRYLLSLSGSGEIEQVFKSGKPGLYRELTEDPDAHSILGELGVGTAMCVPLRVENRTTGVLVLADKDGSEFDEADLDALVSLSGPAALVVAQLERIEEAAESTRRMEDLARMKSDFVSVVSHELRTPLTSIIGSLATLSRHELAPNTAQGEELLASARAQADRLRRLIEDLLTASRIEHGGLRHTPQEIDLAVFMSEVVAGLPSHDRHISVSVEEGADRLVADPDHLARVIINLVDNALKYAGTGPVEVVAARDGNRITVAVVDHGSGIELQERDQAFERFRQLEPPQTRSKGGAGLGLSIVQGIVQAMGGTLELTETPGGGATFVVGLPLRSPAQLAGIS